MEFSYSESLICAIACILVSFGLASCSSSTAGTLQDLAAKTPQTRGIFGAVELKYGGSQPLPGWDKVKRELRAEKIKFDGCYDRAALCHSQGMQQWRQTIQSLKGKSRGEQLVGINSFFNRWPYKTDREVYGRSEYWAAPLEFMRNSGDCEDYAIAKYFSLKYLNMPEDSMRIVAVHDRLRNIGHAVLAIYDGEDIKVLDSLSKAIYPHTTYRQYEPKYAVNSNARWVYVPPRSTPKGHSLSTPLATSPETRRSLLMDPVRPEERRIKTNTNNPKSSILFEGGR